MSVTPPTGIHADESPPVRTSLVLLGAAVACGVACAGLAATAPPPTRGWVLTVCAVGGVLLTAAATALSVAGRRNRQLRAAVREAEAESRGLRTKQTHARSLADQVQGELARTRAEAEGLRAHVAERAARIEALHARLARHDQLVTRLLEEAVPAVMDRLAAGASTATALDGLPQMGDPTFQHLLEVFTRSAARGERSRAATAAACAAAAARAQALATSMLADLREMEFRHGEEVLGDLFHLDHQTSQAGRLADSIALICGGRSGRRWTKPIVIESILRGAMGRIHAYRRLRLHYSSQAAVVGHAAEGVMHLLAELMDNAAKFSPPTEEVHVYVEELTSGVVISIEDAGLVMSQTQLRRAEYAVAGHPLDLTTLSGTRLGLAVVGCLVRKHGLKVSFRPSARGGTSAIVFIPRQLITEPRPPLREILREQRRREAAAAGAADSGHTPLPAQTPAAAPAVASAVPAAGPAAPAAAPSRAVAQGSRRATHAAPNGAVVPAASDRARIPSLPRRAPTPTPAPDTEHAAPHPAASPAPPAAPNGAVAYGSAAPGAAALPAAGPAAPDPVPAGPSAGPSAGPLVPGGPPGPRRGAASDRSVPPFELPRRRRGATLAAPQQPAGSAEPAPPPAPRSEAGHRFNAFREASRGRGRHAAGSAPAPAPPPDPGR